VSWIETPTDAIPEPASLVVPAIVVHPVLL
jgi:hypothetical protein